MYSMDHLIELGMSMTIAQQMVKTLNNSINMNQAVQTTQKFYVVIEGKNAGPFSETEIVSLIVDKKLSYESYIWYPGLKTWTIAENVPEIFKLVTLNSSELGV